MYVCVYVCIIKYIIYVFEIILYCKFYRTYTFYYNK